MLCNAYQSTETWSVNIPSCLDVLYDIEVALSWNFNFKLMCLCLIIISPSILVFYLNVGMTYRI